MSLFKSAETPCPLCDAPKSFECVASVNGDRRPDLRDALLDGSFQKMQCDACGAPFRPAPDFIYVDVGRGMWIMAGPAEAMEESTRYEAQAQATFDKAYGARAPMAARMIGQGFQPRLTLGWGGVTEKLLCGEHGIDDVQLELLKFAVMRHVESPPVDDTMELRLVAVTPDTLTIAWINALDETEIGRVSVPRSAYDEVANEIDLWLPLRRQLTDVLYVDANRLMV